MAIQAKPRGFLFEEVPDDTPQRSAFDLSHRSTLSCDFDYLYPILLEDVIPNSDYELNLNIFMRTAPMVAPIFQDIDVKLYHFWVPARIIFKRWKKLISNGDGSVSIADALAAKKLVDMPFITNYDLAQRGNYSYTDPHGIHRYSLINRLGISYNNDLTGSGEGVGSLADYLGIPTTNLFCERQANLAGDYCAIDFTNGYTTAINSQVLLSPVWSNIRNKTFDAQYMDAITTPVNTDTVATQQDKARARFYQNLRTYNSLPFRAYNKIWYDWFRDENLTPSGSYQPSFIYGVRYVDNTDGDHKVRVYEKSYPSYVNYVYDADLDYYGSSNSSWDYKLNVGLLRKCYTKDYLTSALPSPQRGADVVLPVSGSATVTASGNLSLRDSGNNVVGNVQLNSNNGLDLSGTGHATGNVKYNGGLSVDLSNVNSLTIEALRVANKMQQFLEKFARTGSRYVEMMLSHFDTLVPDAASERPTLIGTARIPIQISANSSQNAIEIGGDTIPQGTQVGQAMTSGNTGFRFHCDEHGYIMSLLCIEPRTFYGSSLERHWLRRGWLDYAWPKFANLGEQPVYSSEVYPVQFPVVSGATAYIGDGSNYDSTMTGADAYNMKPFGYQSRYAEYKYKQDTIHGDFRDTLDDWTLARFAYHDPSTSPNLNESFLWLDNHIRQNIFHTVASLPSSGVDANNVLIFSGSQFAWTDHFWFDMRFDFKAIKCLPLFGVPTL